MKTAIALVVLDDRQWVVEECPFCGETHYHGAGGPDDDPMCFLGHRVPHCLSGTPEGYTGYELQPKDYQGD